MVPSTASPGTPFLSLFSSLFFFSFFFAFLAIKDGEKLLKKSDVVASGKKKREPKAPEAQPTTTSFLVGLYFLFF